MIVVPAKATLFLLVKDYIASVNEYNGGSGAAVHLVPAQINVICNFSNLDQDCATRFKNAAVIGFGADKEQVAMVYDRFIRAEEGRLGAAAEAEVKECYVDKTTGQKTPEAAEAQRKYLEALSWEQAAGRYPADFAYNGFLLDRKFENNGSRGDTWCLTREGATRFLGTSAG